MIGRGEFVFFILLGISIVGVTTGAGSALSAGAYSSTGLALSLVASTSVLLGAWWARVLYEGRFVETLERQRRAVDLIRHEAFERGHANALAQIAKNHDSPAFRTTAREMLGRCPACNRGCIHCARNKKTGSSADPW